MRVIARLFLVCILPFSVEARADFLGEILEPGLGRLEAFYRDLHQNPELSGDEARTAAKVAEQLRSAGLEVREKVGGHGVVGVLRNGPGPIALVRAELDALPVREETGLSYQSLAPGKMHACGHDFHAAALVGTAQLMAHLKDRWAGTLVFVAQPAEETSKGARAMLADESFLRLGKPDHLLALHTTGGLAKGKIGIVPGPVLAAVDGVDIIFRGEGTHGAMPENGVDPFIEVAEFTLKMQTLLGREKRATQPAVISVGSIHGGSRRNIIPPEVKVQLTVRSYAPEVRSLLEKRIPEIARGIARTAGAPEPEVHWHAESDATVNDPALAARMAALLREKLGQGAVVEAEPSMASEDFSEFSKRFHVPSFYFGVGERSEKDPAVTNHSPKFAPDFPRTAPLAIRAMATALLELQAKKPEGESGRAARAER